MSLAVPPLTVIAGAQEFADLVWRTIEDRKTCHRSDIPDRIEAAVSVRLDPHEYLWRKRDRWWAISFCHVQRVTAAHRLIRELGYNYKFPYMEHPVYQTIMGLRMNPRMKDEDLQALDWPDDVPVLKAEDLCPYSEPAAGRKPLWDWVRIAFDPQLEGGKLFEQFCWVLFDVINSHVHPKDRSHVSLGDVPTPKMYSTKSPYSAAEVAEWWREALRVLKYRV